MPSNNSWLGSSITCAKSWIFDLGGTLAFEENFSTLETARIDGIRTTLEMIGLPSGDVELVWNKMHEVRIQKESLGEPVSADEIARFVREHTNLPSSFDDQLNTTATL